jgi:flagellar basal body-associated protein FliL
MTIPGDIAALTAAGSSALPAFKRAFAIDIATAFGIASSRVIVIGITAGSLAVAFTVAAATDGTQIDTSTMKGVLNQPISFPSISVEPQLPSSITSQYSAPVIATAVTATPVTTAVVPTYTNTAPSAADPGDDGGGGIIIIVAAGVVLLGIAIAACWLCSRSSNAKVTVIGEVERASFETVERESQPAMTQSPMPVASEPQANAPTANAVPTVGDPTAAMLLMQQQNMMQQNLIQQQNMVQQQHMQHMERDAHQERAERAAAQERADRQASLERANILSIQSAHSEASHAMQLSAVNTTQVLAANNIGAMTTATNHQRAVSQSIDTSGDGKVDSVLADTNGDGKLDTLIPLNQAHPKEDDSRSASHPPAIGSIGQQTAGATGASSELSMMTVRQLRGAQMRLP